MSLQVRNQISGALERVAGFNDTDSILSPSSQNPISNRAVYAALAQKIDKTVTDLINYYDKTQVYSKPEVRALIGAINTLTIEVVSALPTQDISTTTIYFVGPAAGTNNYDEYVYVGGNWVQIGDTTIDLSNYVTSANLTTVLGDYYTKSEADALFNDYYNKDAVDDLLDTKQNTLDFDNTPIAGSQNPVTSAGIKTALDNILISGNGGSIIKVHHLAGAAAQGNTVTASKGTYSVSSTFDVSGDAIIIGFGEIGNVTITATNGSEIGSTIINIPNFSVYTAIVSYGLDYKSWLIAGGIDPSYYDSLDEVLEDEEVVRRLMTIHESVDYLTTLNNADDEMALIVFNNDICAKWINLRDYALDTFYANEYLAQIMEDANKYGYGEWVLKNIATDSNRASASTVYSTDYAVTRGFEEINQRGWLPSSSDSVNNCYIQYTFPSPVVINQIGMRGAGDYPGSSGIRLFELYVSSNGTNWIPTGKTLTVNGYSSEIITNKIETNTAYQYYRFVLKEIITGGITSASGFKFYLYSWGPKGNIPFMLNNTSPFGVASCSSYWQSNDLFNAYRAFSHFSLTDTSQDGRGWLAGSGANNAWVQYKFTNPVKVKKWDMTSYYGASSSTYTFTLSGSTDGTNFTTLATQTAKPDNYSTIHSININEPDYYLYYRVTVSGTTDSTAQGTRHQFYGHELRISVPVMTNNTTPYGEAIASSIYDSTYDKYMAFTGTQHSHGWNCSQSEYNKSDQAWVGYDFGRPVRIKGVYGVFRKEGSVASKEVRIIARNNTNDPWTIVSDVYTNIKGIDYMTVTDTNLYRYYAIRGSFYINTQYFQLYQLNFYGVDYSEREWDSNHPINYLYDHGLELKELITDISRVSNYSISKVFKHPCELELHSYASTNTVGIATNQQQVLAPDNSAVRIKLSQIRATGILMDIAPVNNNYYPSLIAETTISSPILETVATAPIKNITNPEYVILDSCNQRWSSISEWWLE